MALQIRDGLSPALAQMARQVSDPKPVLEAMALQLVTWTKQAFSDASKRARSWPPRKKPAPHNLLRKSGALWQSIRVGEVTKDHATVGSDRVYAAAQQFGYAPRKLPARPFFPFASPDSPMLPAARAKMEQVAKAKLAAILGAP